jgi:para-nitrobenzyl esterase
MNSLVTYSVILMVTYLCSYLTTAAIRSIDDQKNTILTDAPTIVTTSGQLQGLHVVKSRRIEGFQYLGVPYAEPPVGKLRFQKPQEFNGSKSLRDATKLAPTCIQMRHLPKLINPLLNVDEEHKVSTD